MPTLFVILLLSGIAHGAEVELSDKVRDNFGITTVSVASSKSAQHWQAIAQVLDASTLVTVAADLRAAQAASAASASELKRVEALQQSDNASMKVLEAARAQAAADRGKVQNLRAQLLGSWGMTIARLSDGDLDTLVQRVLSGRTVLARVEIAGNAVPARASTVHVKLLDDARSFNGQLLGAMPLRSDQTIGHAWLLSVESGAAPEWQTGQVFDVELQDASRSVMGIAVPRAALVRWQGRNWVYVEQEANHYLRKAVQIGQPQEQSVLIASGLTAGDKVVVVGAGLLLGAEFAPKEEAEEADAGEKTEGKEEESKEEK